MTIYQYYKKTGNKNIYNKTIAYNILFSICDLKFTNDEDLKTVIDEKLKNLKNLHKFCNIETIKKLILKNNKTYNGKILSSFEDIDKLIKE